MILYYAMGGGLGHLRRAGAVVHTLGIAGPVTIVSASPHATTTGAAGGARIACPPLGLARDPRGLREWLAELVERLRPSCVYLDAFPAGVLGEWCGLPLPRGTAVHHVARILRWARYRERMHGVPPPLERVHVVEPLAPDHAAFLARHASSVARLALGYPPGPSLEVCGPRSRDRSPHWLVVHAGPEAESLELVEHARECAAIEGVEPAITLISPLRPVGLRDGVAHRTLYPATAAFHGADRIFSACGFNTMAEARPFRDRHCFVPLPRALDDQFLRARRARAERW